MGTLETRLAQFVTQFPKEDIPPRVIDQAKRCIVNYCGVALHASSDPSADQFLDLFEEEGAKPEATIVGRQVRSSGRNAALINGYFGHFDDFDDTHMSS